MGTLREIKGTRINGNPNENAQRTNGNPSENQWDLWNPSEPVGTPQRTNGTPKEPMGTPKESMGTPKEPMGTLREKKVKVIDCWQSNRHV